MFKTAEILKNNGVNLRKISLTKLKNGRERYIKLSEIKQEGVDIAKIIEENNLDGNYKYGYNVANLRHEYTKGNLKPEQKLLGEELKLIKKESVAEEFLRISELLKDNGVDLRRIHISKTVNGKSTFVKLSEIEQKGIDINKIIEENNLDGDFEFGSRLQSLRATNNGRSMLKLESKDKELANKLGLLKGTNYLSEILNVAEVLKNNGVDLRKIRISRFENGKQVLIKLSEIKQEGIDIDKIIEENGLYRNFAYGSALKLLRRIYNGGKKYNRITLEQRKLAENLGLVKIIHGQDIGKATFDASVEECEAVEGTISKLMDKGKEK